MKRIDHLTPGTHVVLRYNRPPFTGGNTPITDAAIFNGITGDGDERRASFTDNDGHTWEAYRYNGGWAYGSTAHRLTLESVTLTPNEQAVEDFQQAQRDAALDWARLTVKAEGLRAQLDQVLDDAARAYRAKERAADALRLARARVREDQKVSA